MNKQKQTTLEKRIFAEGETTEEQVYRRVAKFLADNEKEEEEFFYVMNEKLFLPNSPTLVNAGVKGSSGQLNACFVLPIEDSMESIFQTLKDTAMIHKTGGGTGFNFSKLRPKNSKVGVHGGVASGVVSFMKIYDAATNEVKQGGVRRGANMAVLNVDHPDIEEFITCKDNVSVINNFNLSVGISDDFIGSLSHPKAHKKNQLFDKIVEQAWKNGEPGILFLDRINQKHKEITGIKDEIETTNPCGEQPLLPYESCCLGSINLSTFADGDITLDKLIKTAITMLNRILDKTTYPLEKIKEVSQQNRKIGLGVMGYADWLIKKRLIYGSEQALEETEWLAQDIQVIAHKYGKEFNNKTVTTIAPTGSLSILADCNGGIEPLFSLSQITNRMDETFEIISPIVNETFKEYPESLRTTFAKSDPRFVCVNDIPVELHVKTQAVWQKHIDNAVSKTINLPNSATKEDVRNIFILAYELGCKGITVYRDGSRDSQVIKSAEKVNKVVALPTSEVTIVEAKNKTGRPKKLKGETTKYKTGCGNLYITVNSNGNEPVEVFSNTFRGGCPSQTEALTRVVAKGLQHGVPKEVLIEQLNIDCKSCAKSKDADVRSCPNAIARSIMDFDNEYVKEVVQEVKTDSNPIVATEKAIPKFKCPDCGMEQEIYGNCAKCINCGFQKCSG